MLTRLILDICMTSDMTTLTAIEELQVAPVAEDTVCIRSLDWDRDRFDIEFG